jgi:hypothetical protein
MGVPESAKTSWRELRGGRPLVNLYGMTEVLGMISMMDWKSDTDGPAVSMVNTEMKRPRLMDVNRIIAETAYRF